MTEVTSHKNKHKNKAIYVDICQVLVYTASQTQTSTQTGVNY